MKQNQPQPKIVIYGAGSHAKVIIDIFEKQREYSILGMIDDDKDKWRKVFFGYQILGGMDILDNFDTTVKCFIAIGNNLHRKRIADDLVSLGCELGNAIHPSSQIGRDVNIKMGIAIMANVNVNSGTTIGNHVVLNTGCNVDHECEVNDFCYISPGANIAGNVRIGNQSLIGIGASILQGITIGSNCVIGAGAAVIEDIPDNSVAVGVPAKVIKKLS
jgi:sugar O-acyltransferase (sialic acid O-acetyltransferase NeuD family)